MGRRARRGVFGLLLAVLVAVAWWAGSPAHGEEVFSGDVKLDPEGTEEGSIDLAGTCQSVRDLIASHVGGGTTTPLPLSVPRLDLGPLTVKEAAIVADCQSIHEITLDGAFDFGGKRLSLELRLTWDDESDDAMPDVEVAIAVAPTPAMPSAVLSTAELVELAGDIVPSLAVDQATLGDLSLEELSLRFRTNATESTLDVTASTLIELPPVQSDDPTSDPVKFGYLLSATDPVAPGEETVTLNAVSFKSATSADKTINLASVLRGPTGELVSQVELPNMWMAMVQPADQTMTIGDLRADVRSFFPLSLDELPTEFRFDGTLNLGAEVELDALGDDLQSVFGWDDGAVASLHGKIGFDFGTLSDEDSDAFDIESVALDINLPDLAPGGDSPLPDWLSLSNAAMHVSAQEDGGVLELSAEGDVTLDIPDHSQPGGTISPALHVELSLGSEDLGDGIRQTSILLTAEPPPPSGVTAEAMWPHPYGLDWFTLETLGVEVLAQLTTGEEPIVDGVVKSRFSIGGKPFEVSLGLSLVDGASVVDLIIELIDDPDPAVDDTVGLDDVLALFGGFQLPDEFNVLELGPGVRLRATFTVTDGEPSLKLAVNAPGQISVAGLELDVAFLFALDLPAGGDPRLVVGARTSEPVLVSDLLGGALGEEMAAAFEPGGPLAPFNFELPPIGLIVNSSPIETSSGALSFEEDEFFRHLFGCGGKTKPQGCSYEMALETGIHIVTALEMQTTEPAIADFAEALWVPAPETEPGTHSIPILFKASVAFTDDLSFDGVNLDLMLPVRPGPESRPDWFEKAKVGIRLGVSDAGLELGVVGDLTVRFRDSAVNPSDATDNPDCVGQWRKVVDLPTAPEHACYDIFTFELEAQLSVGTGGAKILLIGAVEAEGGWEDPLGIPFLRFDAFKLQLGITFPPTGPQFEIGFLAAGAIFDTDFSGSVLFGLKPLPNPPFVVPTFGGVRISSQAGLEMDDLIGVYDEMRAFAEDLVAASTAAGEAAGVPQAVLDLLALPDVKVDELPNMALRKLDLMVGIASSPELCIEPGLKLGAELWLDAEPLDGPGAAMPGGCNVGPPLADPVACAATEGCFAAIALNATLDGLIASGGIGPFDLGPIHWSDALFDLRLTPTQQSFKVSGTAGIDGVAEGTVDLKVGTDGVAFLGDVMLFPDARTSGGQSLPAFRALIEGQVTGRLGFSDLDQLLDLDFEVHAVLQADFEALARGVLDPALTTIRTNVRLLDEVVGDLIASGDPIGVILDLPETLEELGLAVPPWLANDEPLVPDLVQVIDGIEAIIAPYGYQRPTFQTLLTGFDVDLPGIPGTTIPEEPTCYMVVPGTSVVLPYEGFVIGGQCYTIPPNPQDLDGTPGVMVQPTCWAIEGLVRGTVVDGECYRLKPLAVHVDGICEVLDGVPCQYQAFLDELVYPVLAGVIDFLGLPNEDADGHAIGLPEWIDALLAPLSGPLPPITFDCVDFRFSTSGDPLQQGVNLKVDADLFSFPLKLAADWSFKEQPLAQAASLAATIARQLFTDPPSVTCDPIGTTTVAGTGGGDATTAPILNGYRLTLDDTKVIAGNEATVRAAVDGTLPDTTPLLVAWGDGTTTNATLAELVAGITHAYADDHPATKTPSDLLAIEVTVGGITERTFVTVTNVDPTDLDLTVPAEVDEGEAFTLTGSFADADTDSHMVRISWGDGSPAEEVAIAEGARTFSVEHTYDDDNPTGTPSDTHTIKVTVVDDDTGSTATTSDITVNNIAPGSIVVTPQASSVEEGALVDYQITFTDPGADSHIVTVDWGDGSRPQNSRVEGGARSLTLSHLFADDDPTGTPSDLMPVRVTVSDDDGGSTSATTDIEVDNVAPSVSVVVEPESVAEGGTVAATVTLVDPGIRDTHVAVVDWGDDVFADTTVILGFGQRSFTVSNTYGDNGTYIVGVSIVDDDTGMGTGSTTVTVDNVDPTVAIDDNGTVLADGPDDDGVLDEPTVLTRAGQDTAFSGRGSDPGSDDLVFGWVWDLSGRFDQSVTTTTHRVNPPTDDPAPSPSVQPRDVTDTAAHRWSQPCLYQAGLTVTDDDGGVGMDSTWVVVTGTSSQRRGAGYWYDQLDTSKKGNKNSIDGATLACYLEITSHMSRVFDGRNDASSFDLARVWLNTRQSSAPDDIMVRQLLAAWLNFAHGSVGWLDLVDTDGDRRVDTPFHQVMATAEAIRLDPASTRAELLAQEDILEAINGGS